MKTSYSFLSGSGHQVLFKSCLLAYWRYDRRVSAMFVYDKPMLKVCASCLLEYVFWPLRPGGFLSFLRVCANRPILAKRKLLFKSCIYVKKCRQLIHQTAGNIKLNTSPPCVAVEKKKQKNTQQVCSALWLLCDTRHQLHAASAYIYQEPFFEPLSCFVDGVGDVGGLLQPWPMAKVAKSKAFVRGSLQTFPHFTRLTFIQLHPNYCVFKG